MLRYLVLANGFWSVSKEFLNGRQVNPGMSSSDTMVDYILGVEGLPDEFFQPEEVKERRTYYCKTCKRPVPEMEMERKIGCYSHDLEWETERYESWRSDVFEKYNFVKYDPRDGRVKPIRAWLKNVYRINVNNQQGKEKLQLIMRYISQNYPSNKLIDDPVPMGTRTSFTIENPEDVPIIVLPKTQAEIDNEVKQQEQIKSNKVTIENPKPGQCDICGKENLKNVGAHKTMSHPAIAEVT